MLLADFVSTWEHASREVLGAHHPRHYTPQQLEAFKATMFYIGKKLEDGDVPGYMLFCLRWAQRAGLRRVSHTLLRSSKLLGSFLSRILSSPLAPSAALQRAGQQPVHHTLSQDLAAFCQEYRSAVGKGVTPDVAIVNAMDCRIYTHFKKIKQFAQDLLSGNPQASATMSRVLA